MTRNLEQLSDRELESIYRDLTQEEKDRERALEILTLRGHFRDQDSILGHLKSAAS